MSGGELAAESAASAWDIVHWLRIIWLRIIAMEHALIANRCKLACREVGLGLRLYSSTVTWTIDFRADVAKFAATRARKVGAEG